MTLRSAGNKGLATTGLMNGRVVGCFSFCNNLAKLLLRFGNRGLILGDILMEGLMDLKVFGIWGY